MPTYEEFVFSMKGAVRRSDGAKILLFILKDQKGRALCVESAEDGSDAIVVMLYDDKIIEETGAAKLLHTIPVECCVLCATRKAVELAYQYAYPPEPVVVVETSANAASPWASEVG